MRQANIKVGDMINKLNWVQAGKQWAADECAAQNERDFNVRDGRVQSVVGQEPAKKTGNLLNRDFGHELVDVTFRGLAYICLLEG